MSPGSLGPRGWWWAVSPERSGGAAGEGNDRVSRPASVWPCATRAGMAPALALARGGVRVTAGEGRRRRRRQIETPTEELHRQLPPPAVRSPTQPEVLVGPGPDPSSSKNSMLWGRGPGAAPVGLNRRDVAQLASACHPKPLFVCPPAVSRETIDGPRWSPAGLVAVGRSQGSRPRGWRVQ